MEIERELVVETALSVVGVGLFIVLLVLIGARYTDDGLTATGGFALVGAIVAFVLVMTGIGYWLSAREE